MTDTTRTELGAAIRRRRRALHLSQEQLAERLDVSDRWVSTLERGRGQPSLELLLRLAEALETTPEAFIIDLATGDGARRRDVITWISGLPQGASGRLLSALQGLGEVA